MSSLVQYKTRLMSTYAVKEMYYTLQGEGAQTGRPAVFCRFTGCNLWSGREEDRHQAICSFCDTDFRGTDGQNGGRYTGAELARRAKELWPTDPVARPLVVCTGGEPLLQLDEPLVSAFHAEGLEVAVETNGTVEAPAGLDWICVSPKAGTDLKITAGHELKLVFPQPGAEPERFEHLPFKQFFLQPMDGPQAVRNTEEAVRYCLEHPRWRLSLQTHKYLNIP